MTNLLNALFKELKNIDEMKPKSLLKKWLNL